MGKQTTDQLPNGRDELTVRDERTGETYIRNWVIGVLMHSLGKTYVVPYGILEYAGSVAILTESL